MVDGRADWNEEDLEPDKVFVNKMNIIEVYNLLAIMH